MGGQFPMRLAQDAGSLGLQNADIVPTYDFSCAMGKMDGCPHGNVHNVHKQPIGARMVHQLRRMKLGEEIVSQGPRVSSVMAVQKNVSLFDIRVDFEGTTSLHMGSTWNCTTCCDGDSIGEFDVSSDGAMWFIGTAASIKDGAVHFQVEMSPSWHPPKSGTPPIVFIPSVLYSVKKGFR